MPCSNEITMTIINMGRKFRGRAESPSNTKSPGLRPTSIPSGNRNGLRTGDGDGAPPPFGRGAGSPSHTKSPGLRPTFIPSGTLNRPTVWPQYINVANRQERTDSQRSDSIGRTVLQTVPKKSKRKKVIIIVSKLTIWRCAAK